MPLFCTSPADRAELTARLDRASHVVVVALCAESCSMCREFEGACAAVAESRPGISLVWVDIEDDAPLIGDLDIAASPTLAIFAGDELRYYGPVSPNAAVIERLIDRPATPAATAAPQAIVGLVASLRIG